MENLICFLVVIILAIVVSFFGGAVYFVALLKVLALVALIGGLGFLFIVICDIIND